MASFDFCIDQAFKAGKITKDVAEKIKTAEDPEAAINEVVGNLTRQKREAAIQAVRLSERWSEIESHPEGLYDGLVSILTKDQTGKAGYANVEYTGRFYEKKFMSQWSEAGSKFRTRMLGFEQDEVGLNKLVKAIYGEAIDDAEIKGMADEWLKITENIRNEFNAKGGSISKNEKWLMPQNHDFRAIQSVGLDEWKNSIKPKLDRSQMLDDAGQPLSDKAFDEGLDYTYETITSGGLNKAKDFTVPIMGKKLARKGSERRFLYFKDADGWLDYQKEFGKGDVFTTFTDHIEMKANDIAMMEVLGTSPESTFKALKSQVEKSGKMTERQRWFSDAVYNAVSGKTSDGDLTGLASVMQTTKNVLTASMLGRAFLSAVSDTAFQAVTSKYNGLPAFKSLGRTLSLLNPANEADRVFAGKIGFIADSWTNKAAAANRYADVYGTGATAKMAEGVMRGSLLSPWTDSGRMAFGMEFSSMLADNFAKTIDELDPSIQRAFETYGIGKSDWDTFRTTKPLDHKGGKFADATQEGGQKFHMMIMSETDFAVPTPDAKVRAITSGGLGRSTIEGQAWRSAMMLKSFPVTIATTHFYRAAYQATASDKLAYIGLLAASTTALGGIAIQAKDILAGKEPRPVDSKFVAAAFTQGGGTGILGDFLFSDVNRFGGGITETITGPVGQLLNTSLKFTLGNVREAIKGEETNVLGEAAVIANRYSPDIWQTTLFSNAMFDQIEMLANPDAQRKFNRIVRKRQKEYNQGYWWKPGKATPEFLR